MMTSTELAPLADQSFDPGPPREQSIELSRVVDRGIRESRMIDFEALCIEEGEKVWTRVLPDQDRNELFTFDKISNIQMVKKGLRSMEVCCLHIYWHERLFS